MIQTLAQWLIGEFNNRKQAIDDPVWYVHLKLWHRPVQCELGQFCIFAEQSNILQLDQPYRQRLLVLNQISQTIQGQYWAFKDPQKFKAAGQYPEKLEAFDLNDLIELPGCKLQIELQSGKYKAQPNPDLKCCFEYAGKTRQVVIGFEVESQKFISYDRGVDPDTGQSLWGAMMGPYCFDKEKAYELGNS